MDKHSGSRSIDCIEVSGISVAEAAKRAREVAQEGEYFYYTKAGGVCLDSDDGRVMFLCFESIRVPVWYEDDLETIKRKIYDELRRQADPGLAKLEANLAREVTEEVREALLFANATQRPTIAFRGDVQILVLPNDQQDLLELELSAKLQEKFKKRKPEDRRHFPRGDDRRTEPPVPSSPLSLSEADSEPKP